METLLVDEKVAEEFLPRIAELYQEKKVELRGCREIWRISRRVQSLQQPKKTGIPSIWARFWRSKLFSGIEEAIEHINKYGSHHTDSIITENYSLAREFLAGVDSSSV